MNVIHSGYGYSSVSHEYPSLMFSKFVEDSYNEGKQFQYTNYIFKYHTNDIHTIYKYVASTMEVIPDNTCVLDKGFYCTKDWGIFIYKYGDRDSLHGVIFLGTEFYTDKFRKIHFDIVEKDNSKYISWNYLGANNGLESLDVALDQNKIGHNSFYPFLPKPLDEYLTEFNDSKSSILLLCGDAGTGKSSFIKNYIVNFNKFATCTFDSNVLEKDQFFISFLRSNKNLLCLEDSDTFLGKRSSGNHIMSKFLNTGEGLFDISGKKIIFSTNITDVSKIDEALIRPGRCFDIVNFRKLNLNEANVVCSEFKLPALSINKEYSLGEIFNKNHHKYKHRIGF